LRKRKISEFCSEPFLGRDKPSEFWSESFADEINLGIPIQTIFGIEKTSHFRFESFSEEKKTSEFRSEPFLEEKKTSEFHSKLILETENTRKSVPNHFWDRKHSKKDYCC
jgi:hypothetical protein